MTYQDLLELLQSLSSRELRQEVVISIEDYNDVQLLSAENLTRNSISGQIFIEVTPEL